MAEKKYQQESAVIQGISDNWSEWLRMLHTFNWKFDDGTVPEKLDEADQDLRQIIEAIVKKDISCTPSRIAKDEKDLREFLEWVECYNDHKEYIEKRLPEKDEGAQQLPEEDMRAPYVVV